MHRVLAAATVALLGCGDQAAQLPDAAPDAASDAAPDSAIDAAPPGKLPDLRFQWVGAYPRYTQMTVVNFDPFHTFTSTGEFAWSPLELATRLGGRDTGWELTNFTPVVPIEHMISIAKGGELLAMATDEIDLIAQGYVITSLDVTPQGYGLIATRPLGAPIYSGGTIDIDRANLTAWVADQGQRGRVVTALSRSGTALHALSFAHDGDTTTYDTQVVDATFATLVSAATDLAANGYIITAFGRDGEGPLLLVGTRPAGVTTPRTITAQTTLDPDLADHGALVAWVLDAGPGDPPFPQVAILER